MHRYDTIRAVIVKKSDRYIGRAPGVMLGGMHGKDEAKVYAELCQVVEGWVRIQETDGDPLPPETAHCVQALEKEINP